MSSYGLYLASVATPIAQRVLTGLGFGVISYVGLNALFQSIQQQIITAWGQIPMTALSLLSMSGVSQAIGIILSAIAARIAMMQLKKLALL